MFYNIVLVDNTGLIDYLIGENFVGENYSPLFPDENFHQLYLRVTIF